MYLKITTPQPNAAPEQSGMLLHVMIMSNFSVISYRGWRLEFNRRLQVNELRTILLDLATDDLRELSN